MSETVHYKGVLERLYRQYEETLEEQCKKLLGNVDLESYYDSYQEKLTEANEYHVYGGNLYKVHITRELNPYDEIFIANKLSLDRIGFEVKYYNGGCCFGEAIAEALDKIQ